MKTCPSLRIDIGKKLYVIECLAMVVVAVSEDIDITSLGGGSLISSCGDITRL